MKVKIVPTERRLVKQFKPQKLDVKEGEDEILRLIQLSKDKNRERPILATLQFDDESGNGILNSQPISFDAHATTNIAYWAMEMINTRYANASQSLKDEFLNQLYEALAGGETGAITEEDIENVEETRDSESPFFLPETPVSKSSQKDCLACGESMAETMTYCPYCGRNQNEQRKPEQDETEVIQENAQICPACGEEIAAGLLYCPYCGHNQKERLPETKETVPEIPEAEQLAEKSPMFDAPQDFLAALETLIQKQEAANIELMTAEITEKVAQEKEQAQEAQEAQLQSEEKAALDLLQKKFIEDKQEVKDSYAKKRQTSREELEARLAQKAEESIHQARESQKESAQTLLHQLTKFLNVEGSLKT